MPRVMLFVMDGCETCEEMERRLRGRAGVEIVNVDRQSERRDELVKEMKAQGDIRFDELPQCVLQKENGKFALCDTEHIDEVLENPE